MNPYDSYVLGNPERGVCETDYEEALNWYGMRFDIFCKIFSKINSSFSDIGSQNRLRIFHETSSICILACSFFFFTLFLPLNESKGEPGSHSTVLTIQ